MIHTRTFTLHLIHGQINDDDDDDDSYLLKFTKKTILYFSQITADKWLI